jgi:hypothetical protein
MKVFTVTTDHPEWESLTRECVLRVKSYSGHDVQVFEAKNQWDAHVLKLTAPLIFEDFVWFVDSDWWPVKPFEFPQIPESGFCAPRCMNGKERYITTCADTDNIFGTTIIGMDMVSYKVRHCFRKALSLQSSFFWDDKPRMDEFFLNVAVLAEGLPVTYLTGEWIWNAPVVPEAIGVHAGGMWPKLNWLKAAVEKSID